MRVYLILILLAVTPAALAQGGSATPPPKPCSSEAHRQFDFWVGEWEVRSAANPANVAYNSISLEQGGCVLVERYKSGPVFTGISLSFYVAPRKVWHQSWVDNQGGSLFGEGGLRDGSMVLESDAGANPFNRVTWTPNDDGTVRQHWQRSTDGQDTWTTVFDGTYTRVKKPE